MLREILEEMIESIDLGVGDSRRLQNAVRVAFGLLGAVLSLAGVYHVIVSGIDGAGAHLRLMAAMVFGFLACFCLGNVVLARPWRWPGKGFLFSLIGTFVIRIVLGP